MADIDKDNFIRCHAAIQVLCSNAIPCIQDTLDQWHHGIQTPSCTSPSECPSKKKPTGKNKSCPACVEWGKEIEKAWYVPPSKEPPKPNKAADGNIDKTKKKDNIPWQNVNPTLLGNRNPVESAKAFMNHLLEGEDYKNLGDFDAASILKFMMRFKDFHKEDTNYYELIKEVYDIRNEICHMKINDKLYVDSDTMEDYFKKIIALANGIRIKRPDHFTKDLTSEFNDIKLKPITSDMKRDALKPFSEAKKCAILQNMQEEQRETNQRLEESMKVNNEKTSKILKIVEKSNTVSAETQRGFEKENNAKVHLIHAGENKQFLNGLRDAVEDEVNPEKSCEFRRYYRPGSKIVEQIFSDLKAFVESKNQDKCMVIISSYLIDALNESQADMDKIKKLLLQDYATQNIVLLEMTSNNIFSGHSFATIKVKYDEDLQAIAKESFSIWCGGRTQGPTVLPSAHNNQRTNRQGFKLADLDIGCRTELIDKLDLPISSVKDWRHLASHYRVPNTKIEVWRGKMPFMSASNSLFEWLGTTQPDLTVSQFKNDLHAFERKDAVKILENHGYK